ncbi:MAG: aryl-alcohol dehydrogenase [Halieaceae bacterium]|jgi:aryl-alcohol dehydrogenase
MDIQAALAYSAETPFELHMVRLDEPRPDEVLVRIRGVGICHTDLALKSGLAPFPFPAVLGHEGAGVVAAIGSEVKGIEVGDHVVMSFLSCGNCTSCGKQEPAYCEELMALNYSGARPDGSATLHHGDTPLGSHFFCQSSFATYALARAPNLVKVPKDLPLELLGPLGCGIQTGAGAVMRSLDLQAGSTLVIAGAGAVGLSAVMAAHMRKCRRIIVIEPQASRRALALELGASDALDPAGDDLLRDILALEPRGVCAALDTSGNEKALQTLVSSLATKGVLGLLGSAAHDTRLPGDVNGLLSRGQSIRGIIEGDSDPKVFIPELLEHYRAGRFPFTRMMTTYPFGEINRAVEEHESGLNVKAILTMD